MSCPCRTHAVLRPCRSESDFCRPRQSTAWARHGKSELAINDSPVRIPVSRSVLSPLLWCAVFDVLVARLSGGGTHIQGYAENICLLPVGKFPSTASGLKQWALHTVEIRCDEVGLSVNPDKTRLVVFTKRRKLPGFFETHSLGFNLHRCISVKYLGVVLDCRLTWREHVDVKVRKVHNLLWACRRVCGAMWGLRPKVAHWPYVSIIRPSITFASLVW
jgi:hypothetical protein